MSPIHAFPNAEIAEGGRAFWHLKTLREETFSKIIILKIKCLGGGVGFDFIFTPRKDPVHESITFKIKMGHLAQSK